MVSVKAKEKDESILVLAVDVDNDLQRKTNMAGPVLGRDANLKAASALALSDPLDTDGNTMFQAVKVSDDLKNKGYNVNVATITGSESEGYAADREVSRQLDLVLARYNADSCVFVTDGASDSRVLPIISSRIRVNSVNIVTMKQASQIENTYFTILEKLKEPHYSRIVFGIPAVLLIIFAISYLLGLGWQLPALLIGAYLLLKGFGLEENFLGYFTGLGFSFDRFSFVFYLSAIVFFVASILIAYTNYSQQLQINTDKLMMAAFTTQGFLLLLPMALILYLIGRIIDTSNAHYMFRSLKYGRFIGSTVVLWVMLYSFTAWVIGQIYFSELLLFAVGAVLIGAIISEFTSFIRVKILRGIKVKGKDVINEMGASIGKARDVDTSRGTLTVTTSFGSVINYSIDRIVEISDRVVVR